MDGCFEDEWDDESFLNELVRVHDEAMASRNPNPTPTPTPAPVPAPVSRPVAATPISYLPASSAYASVSYLPAAAASASTSVSYIPAASAASSPSPALGFSPPRELIQRPSLPLPPAASSHSDALSTVGRGFSPPRELSQRPTAEERDCAIVGVPGPAVGERLMGTGGNVGAKREREAREVERLKKELNRVSKQMNDLKNECTELRKDRAKKDLQIRAKEAEIQNLKKANGGFAIKDPCGIETNAEQSVHVPTNGALHAAGTWASTRAGKSNSKVKDTRSLQEDLCLKHTMIDNTTSISGGLFLEGSTPLDPRSVQCKETKMIGVQTDNTWNSEHPDCKKVLLERISSNLRAIWGMPTNSLSDRNLISKITISCSEEILALLQCARLPDMSGTSSKTSSSNDAISQLYDIFVKMSNEKIPIQTFLEEVLNLCTSENAAIIGRTLRILHKLLQHLLNYRTESNRRNNISVEPYVDVHTGNKHKDNSTMLIMPGADLLRWQKMSLPFTFWSSVFTLMLEIGIKYSDESIRVDALSIMILIARTTDPIEECQKFEFTSIMERLHQLLQKDNGVHVKNHSVRLLFLLLNCPAMLKLLCSGGKDGPGQMVSEESENARSKLAISSIFEDLSECLSFEAICSQGIELCRLVIILLAYIASSGKLGYEVLLGSVTTHGASFLELIMKVLASQIQYEAQELLKERCLLMREALILLNRLASHANFSKPTLEVLTGSKLCAALTIDVANRLPQTQMGSDLAELAQKFRSRVYAFLEEKPLIADGSNPNVSSKFQEQHDSSVNRSNPR